MSKAAAPFVMPELPTSGTMTVSDINVARHICCLDLRHFNDACDQLEGYITPRFHYVIDDFLQGKRQEWVAKTKKIMGFRLAAKSTRAARRYLQWRWLRNPYLQAIIHSSTNDLAEKMAKAMLNGMRSNPIMSHLAPRIDSAETQYNLTVGGREIKHEQGYSLQVAGIKTSMTGSRADLYIFDDPEPEIEPESMRDRIISSFGEAQHILHAPTRHARRFNWTEVPVPERTQLVIIGQPHCPESAYYPNQSEMDDDDGGHPLANALELRIDAIDQNTGYWLWPYMMEPKHWNEQENRPMTIAEAMKQYTSLNWALQMRIDMDALSLKGAVLHLNHIQSVRRLVPHPVGIIDPADGGACETGVAIGGPFGNQVHISFMGGFTGESYEGDVEDGTIGESIWRQIFDIGDEFKVQTWMLEKNYKAAASACRRYLAKTGRKASVLEYAASQNKLRRICNALEQPCNNGMLSANPDVLMDRNNTRQLKGLRFDRLPEPCDRIDALAELLNTFIENRTLSSAGNVRMDLPANFKISQFQRLGNDGRSPFVRARG